MLLRTSIQCIQHAACAAQNPSPQWGTCPIHADYRAVVLYRVGPHQLAQATRSSSGLRILTKSRIVGATTMQEKRLTIQKTRGNHCPWHSVHSLPNSSPAEATQEGMTADIFILTTPPSCIATPRSSHSITYCQFATRIISPASLRSRLYPCNNMHGALPCASSTIQRPPGSTFSPRA